MTGATGFIGSHILEGLLADGHSLYVVKRSFSETDRIEKFLKDCKTYDLDRTPIQEIFEESPIECIIHCATYYGRNDKECIKNVESNLLFPLKLLSCGIEHGIKNFVNTDSFFGNQIKSEQDLHKELYMGGYTLSKRQFRQWGQVMSAKYKLNFINMKLEHVYGERDDSNKFIPYVVEQCRNNIPVLKLSEGKQERDFIYVGDVVNAYRIVIKSLIQQCLQGYMEYNVGTGRVWRLREFVEIIHTAVKSNTLLDWGTIEMKKGEIMSSKADNADLKKIGWIPAIVEDEQIEDIFRNWERGGVNSDTFILKVAA